MDEQTLIAKLCQPLAGSRADVIVPSGDDAACVQVPTGHQMVVTVDTLVNGVHFPEGTDPSDIGYKAAMVNLSDLAAVGASPAWLTCSLTLPENDVEWVQGFMAGLSEVISAHDLALIGGDLSRGPLSVTIQAMGFVPDGQAVLRSGAQPGDTIVVMDTLGAAGLGLQVALGAVKIGDKDANSVLRALNRPKSVVAAGLALRPLASAMTDISDGFLIDLQDILIASGVGATLVQQKLPICELLARNLSKKAAFQLALSSGDAYSLLATLPQAKIAQWHQVCAENQLTGFKIGQIEQKAGLRLADGQAIYTIDAKQGFQHF